jgi:hypothetical protein
VKYNGHAGKYRREPFIDEGVLRYIVALRRASVNLPCVASVAVRDTLL